MADARCSLQVVRGHEHRLALTAQVGQQFAERFLRRLVDGRKRLVHEQW